MGIFTGSSGYEGALTVGVPSGGGVYKDATGPLVPGLYPGSCPGDPGCPGRDVEKSSFSWSDVGKSLALTAGTQLIKRLERQGTPGDRTVASPKAKGETASAADPITDPFWGGASSVNDKKPPTSQPTALSPGLLIVIGVVGIIGLALASHRG